VFGVLFSVLFYGEVVPPRVFAGFIVVFAAIFLSESDLKFLSGAGRIAAEKEM
jgi:drug/metabolite transporter (DMT)-like permease